MVYHLRCVISVFGVKTYWKDIESMLGLIKRLVMSYFKLILAEK